MYVEILIEYPTKKIDKYFTYLVPNEIQDKIKAGMKVRVPFGKKIINGFVMSINNTYTSSYKLKEIIDIVDEEIILSEELRELGLYIKDKTLCPLITAYQAMLPSSLKLKDKHTDYNYYKKYLVLNKSAEDVQTYLEMYHRKNKQTELLEAILDNEKVLKSDYSYSIIKALKDKELIKEVKEQEYRIQKLDIKPQKHELNEEQQAAYDTIKNTNNHTVFLLEGITGSGKTEVYLNLIDNCIKNGKSAIMLVPEISLTIALVEKFYEWFGSKVAIFHSRLSDGEKYDEYLKIVRNEVSLVVGTRSAIFMPLNNLGIIIIDEEHSETYKQESVPRYNAIDIAKYRGSYHNIPVVLGSATPTLETRARAIKGVYKHLFLTKRAGGGQLPETEIVDMVTEVKKKNFIFSDSLKNCLNECLDKHNQAIILLNRRGFSTTITCSSCGFTYKCPNCDITLTYHKSTNNLRCHYCGYSEKCDLKCPNCHEEALSYLGIGTEKVELELKNTFPNIKVIRMDQDTTSTKGSYEKIINDFKNHQYDVLLGTQMISKGFDFPDVTLVGIINADNSLNIPDFRSNEKTFALLYQSSGRAGRRKLKSKVIIQTYNYDNYVLNCVKNNDFNSFYNYEMNIRKILKYPPYYYLVSLKIISQDYNLALEESNKIALYLKNNIDKSSYILGPTTANMFKLNNNYRFQIVIKYRFDDKLFATLKYLDDMYINENKISLEIDIDPVRI